MAVAHHIAFATSGSTGLSKRKKLTDRNMVIILHCLSVGSDARWDLPAKVHDSEGSSLAKFEGDWPTLSLEATCLQATHFQPKRGRCTNAR